MSARRTAASGSSSWHTPRATDGSNGGPSQTGGALVPQVATWPTPTAMDSRASGAAGYQTETRNSGTTLTDAAVRQWPTPLAADDGKQGARHLGGNPTLKGAAEMWPTPDASVSHGYNQSPSPGASIRHHLAGLVTRWSGPLDLTTAKHGNTSSRTGRTLNPRFVEWLMGWPMNWSDTGSSAFGCSVTESSPFKPPMPSPTSIFASPATSSPPEPPLTEHAHAILNGELQHISVTQLQAFRACERKWGFDKIDHFPRRVFKSQEIGTRGHAEIDHYLKTGQDGLGEIAAAGKHLLPAPQTVWSEYQLADLPVAITAAGLPFKGAVDVVDWRTPGWLEIVDHKFIGSIDEWPKYGNKPADLGDIQTDYGLQFAVYQRALYLSGWFADRQMVRLRLNLFQTKGPKRAEPVVWDVPFTDRGAEWEHVESLAQRMRGAARAVSGIVLGHVYGSAECDRYGGCSYAGQCFMAAIRANPGAVTGGSTLSVASPPVNAGQSVLSAFQPGAFQPGMTAFVPPPPPGPPAVTAGPQPGVAHMSAQPAGTFPTSGPGWVKPRCAICGTEFAEARPPGHSIDPQFCVMAQHHAAILAARGGHPAGTPVAAPVATVLHPEPTLAAQRPAGNRIVDESTARDTATLEAGRFRASVDRDGLGTLAPSAPSMTPQQAAFAAQGMPIPPANAFAQVVPPDAPKSDPAKAAIDPPGSVPGPTPPPLPSAPIIEPVKRKRGRPPAPKTESADASVDLTGNGLIVYVDAFPNAAASSLNGYVAMMAEKVRAAANPPPMDLRCAPQDSPLGYGKWKGVLTAAVRAEPPPPGAYTLITSGSELALVVAEALEPLCAPGDFIRGIGAGR